jgi:hypothetical protein
MVITDDVLGPTDTNGHDGGLFTASPDDLSEEILAACRRVGHRSIRQELDEYVWACFLQHLPE